MVIINALLLLAFASNILIMLWRQSCSWYILVFVPLYFGCLLLRYFRLVSSMVRKTRESFDGEVTVQTMVTDTCIRQSIANGPNRAENETEFSNIKKAIRTKKMILLVTKANLVYIFQKDTFGDRGMDEFLTFLQSKGIKVR